MVADRAYIDVVRSGSHQVVAATMVHHGREDAAGAATRVEERTS
jgi:hypothetical protein